MQEINRIKYLNELVSAKHNHLIKVITGIKRCGKSYLLDPIFKNHLINNNVNENYIIKLDLDLIENSKYRDPKELFNYVMNQVKDNDIYYVILDEIQLVSNFEEVLNSFLKKSNLDVYVTGSNSKFLSSDIITEFRGRSTEIHVYPLSFKEFVELKQIDENKAWKEYVLYGGLPPVVLQENEKHLINIYNEKELDKDSTYSKMKLVQKEGNRSVKRNVQYYNLDTVILFELLYKSIKTMLFNQIF